MIKQKIKQALYYIGVIQAWHRIRNARNLTVVMFHRVLPANAADFANADPEYTLEVELFVQCLEFFKRHYNPVSLNDLDAASKGSRTLPQRPLLITFDDGWRDTLTIAAPALRKFKMPALCFIATSVLDNPDPAWWQDILSRAWRERAIDWNKTKTVVAKLYATFAESGPDEGGSYVDALSLVSQMPAELRTRFFDETGIASGAPLERQMLTTAEVHELIDMNIAVGAHGVTHIPLTLSENPLDELEQSRRQLESLMHGGAQTDVVSMSFPHGRFSRALVQLARRTGYKFVMTSVDNLVNTAKIDWGSLCFGRISISAADIVDTKGVFSESKCAWHLFNRPTA